MTSAVVILFALMRVNTASAETSANQCAIDLCGDTKSFLNLDEMISSRKNVPINIKNEFDQNIRPLLDNWVRFSIETLRKQLNSSIDQIAQLQKSSLTDNEKIINNLIWALGHKKFGSLLSAATTSSYGMIVIDKTKAATLLTDLNPVEQDYLVQYVQAIVNRAEYGELNFLYSDTYINLLALKYPASSLKVAARLDGQHFLDIQNELMTIDPNLDFLSSITKQNFVKLAHGEEVILNPDTQGRIGRARLNLALYHDVLTPGPTRDLFLKRPITYDHGQLNQKLKDLSSYMTTLILDESKIQLLKSKMMDQCLASYNLAMSTAPSDLAIRSMLSKIESVKKVAKEVASNYSGNASGAVDSAIQNAKFIMPVSIRNVAPLWISVVKDMMASDQEDAKARTSARWISRYSVDIADDFTDDMLFFNIKNVCQSLQPTGLSDHALTTLGAISVSWQSVIYPEVGIGVVAHEIGHIVSSISSRGSIWPTEIQQVRQCIALRHLSSANFNFAHVNNVKYVEEDWADMFAAQVMKRLRPDFPFLRNYACVMLGKDGSSYGSSQRPLSLVNSNRSDTHSADFFRVIQLQLEMGSLPPSCQSQISNDGLSFFKQCGK